MVNDIYVLGGGITGLAAGYILDLPVITKEVGGQLSSNFSLGPRFIHSKKETREFVKRLGLPITERQVKIGYFYDNDYHDSIPPSLVNEYNLKTRGTIDVTSSIGKSSFTALKVSFSDVIEKLRQRVKIIQDKILRITADEMFGLKGKYKYRKIISTIPLPELYSLCRIYRTFNYRPIGYNFVTFDEALIRESTFNYDYVYYPELKYPQYRITKVSRGFVYEYCYSPFIKYPIRTIWHDMGKILPTLRAVSPSKKIILLGRFAEWNDNIMFHHILQKLSALDLSKEDVQVIRGVQL